MRSAHLTAAALALIGLAAGALYLPFLGNPLIFDDRVLLSGRHFADFAQSPFALSPRQPPYFTLAFVQTLWGTLQAHRIASLIAHVACCWALYALIREAQRGLDRPLQAAADDARRRLAAFCAAALFALHPAAVYGAAYLAQRSIVFATLFGLLSLLFFLRGLRRGSYADAISAAAWYTLAVLSKEHALPILAVACAGALGAAAPRVFKLRYAAAYLAACAPAALLVILLQKGFVGVRYEPEFDAVVAHVMKAELVDVASSPWLSSAIAQAALFFRYAAVWLWPTPGRMALDLRVDFHSLWSPWIGGAAVIAFAGCGLLALYLLLARRGRLAVAGFGLAWFWLLFLIELSVIRFQEPFVLYRSYLWAPGIALLAAAALSRLRPRFAAIAVLALAPALAWQAHGRLATFSSGLATWEDAAAKLPARAIPGGWRTLYEAGREQLASGQSEKAIATTDRCMAQYPDTFHCFLARASVHILLEQFEQAVPYLARAMALRPADGVPRHHLGLVLEELGCRARAREQYAISLQLGFRGAGYRLEAMDSPGKGLLPPPSVLARRAGPCRAPSYEAEQPPEGYSKRSASTGLRRAALRAG